MAFHIRTVQIVGPARCSANNVNSTPARRSTSVYTTEQAQLSQRNRAMPRFMRCSHLSICRRQNHTHMSGRQKLLSQPTQKMSAEIQPTCRWQNFCQADMSVRFCRWQIGQGEQCITYAYNLLFNTWKNTIKKSVKSYCETQWGSPVGEVTERHGTLNNLLLMFFNHVRLYVSLSHRQ